MVEKAPLADGDDVEDWHAIELGIQRRESGDRCTLGSQTRFYGQKSKDMLPKKSRLMITS